MYSGNTGQTHTHTNTPIRIEQRRMDTATQMKHTRRNARHNNTNHRIKQTDVDFFYFFFFLSFFLSFFFFFLLNDFFLVLFFLFIEFFFVV